MEYEAKHGEMSLIFQDIHLRVGVTCVASRNTGFSITVLRELEVSYTHGILFVGQECTHPTVAKFCSVRPNIFSVTLAVLPS